MDSVQKHYNCITVPTSKTSRSYIQIRFNIRRSSLKKQVVCNRHVPAVCSILVKTPLKLNWRG
jgi:hypothetical protein